MSDVPVMFDGLLEKVKADRHVLEYFEVSSRAGQQQREEGLLGHKWQLTDILRIAHSGGYHLSLGDPNQPDTSYTVQHIQENQQHIKDLHEHVRSVALHGCEAFVAAGLARELGAIVHNGMHVVRPRGVEKMWTTYSQDTGYLIEVVEFGNVASATGETARPKNRVGRAIGLVLGGPRIVSETRYPPEVETTIVTIIATAQMAR
jgi:hypothetical protein